MSSARRVLVAGIGNVFFADDGFGVEVASRLTGETWPAGVELREYGIRGIHLAYDLLDGVDVLVLVDALPMGEPPGTLAVLEVDTDEAGGAADGTPLDAHTMSPAAVLGQLRRIGGHVGRVLVLGCEPAELDTGIGLSDAVTAAVPSALVEVRRLVAELSSAPPPSHALLTT